MAVYFLNTKCNFYVNISKCPPKSIIIKKVISLKVLKFSPVLLKAIKWAFFKFINKKNFTPTPLDKQILYIF